MNGQRFAVVLSLFETGLGIAKSLGRQGVPVYGIDSRKDAGYYSRYLRPLLLPNPLEQESAFVDALIALGATLNPMPVLYIGADDYLVAVSRNRHRLAPYFLFNLPPHDTVRALMDKCRQHHLVEKAGISAPRTHCVYPRSGIAPLPVDMRYPVFVKGLDVNIWRRHMNSSVKGFLISDPASLANKLEQLIGAQVPCVVQEVIPGSDDRHYKFSGYVSRSGELLLGFTSQKLRQNPVHFGVGSAMQSIEYPELMALGKALFKRLDYRGVGSAEFKLDERDGQLKLIEINLRYWQQNFLATACGMNFPLTQFLDLTGRHCPRRFDFETGVKWVNCYLDTAAFLQYRREGCLSFYQWWASNRGRKVDANFSWDDPLPGFYRLGIRRKLSRLPTYFKQKQA